MGSGFHVPIYDFGFSVLPVPDSGFRIPVPAEDSPETPSAPLSFQKRGAGGELGKHPILNLSYIIHIERNKRSCV